VTDDKSFFERLHDVQDAVDEANAEEPQNIVCWGGIRLQFGAGNREEVSEDQ